MIKRSGIALITLAVLSLILMPSAFAGPNMKEGLWEITGEMKLIGLPFPMPPVPVKYTQCLTKKDMVPQKPEKGQDCKMIKNEVVGNTVNWAIQCKDRNGVTDSTGKITYKGNSFSGSMRNVTKDKGGTKTETAMEMTGKRTGACK